MATNANVFEIGAASVDITPSEMLPLAGYGDRLQAAAEVSDNLEANIVVVRRDGRAIVFVGCDVLFVGYLLRKRLLALLDDCVGSDELFLSATHTHFAPATDPGMPRIGRASPEYVETVAFKIASAVRNLMSASFRTVSLMYHVGLADHAIHRRLPVTRWRIALPPWGTRWEMRPNADVPIDRRIRLVAFTDAGNRAVAVCWSYACHPVCFPEKRRISADFPGVVRRAVRMRFGDIPIIFWQGFAGDVRPKSIVSSTPPTFGSFTQEQWRSWSESLASRVIDVMLSPAREVSGDIRTARRRIATADLGLKCPGRDISIHEVRFGDELDVFGISAEPVNAYTSSLEAARAEQIVIPVGYIDGVPCYLPTDDMVAQGGYEAAGFRRLFGVSGRFRKEISGIIGREFERKVLP